MKLNLNFGQLNVRGCQNNMSKQLLTNDVEGTANTKNTVLGTCQRETQNTSVKFFFRFFQFNLKNLF